MNNSNNNSEKSKEEKLDNKDKSEICVYSDEESAYYDSIFMSRCSTVNQTIDRKVHVISYRILSSVSKQSLCIKMI